MPSIKQLPYKKFKKYYKKNEEFKKQLNIVLITSFQIETPKFLTFEKIIELDVFPRIKLMLLKNKETYPESKNPLTYFTERLWYIEKEAKVIGFGILRFFTKVPLLYVHTVCILKEERRKGYCKRMITQIMKSFPNVTITVDVRTENTKPNTAAINCYKKLGFTFTSLVYNHVDGENKMMIYNPVKSLPDNDLHQIIHQEEPNIWKLIK